jgi:hypothetical protein
VLARWSFPNKGQSDGPNSFSMQHLEMVFVNNMGLSLPCGKCFGYVRWKSQHCYRPSKVKRSNSFPKFLFVFEFKNMYCQEGFLHGACGQNQIVYTKQYCAHKSIPYFGARDPKSYCCMFIFLGQTLHEAQNFHPDTTFGGGNTQYTWPNISRMLLELHLILVQATISGHNWP